jgi:hypothetical protein
MFRVIAAVAAERDSIAFGVLKVAVASFASAEDEPGSFPIRYQLSHLPWHSVST